MKIEGIEFVSPRPFVVCVQRMQKFGAGMLFQKDNTSIRLREFSWVDPAEDKTGFRLQAISWGGRNTLPNHTDLDVNGELAGIPEGTHVRLNIQAGFPTSLGERLYVLGWDLLVFFPVAVFMYRAYRTPSSESLGGLGLVILLPVLNFFLLWWNTRSGKSLFSDRVRRALLPDPPVAETVDPHPRDWIDSLAKRR